MKDWFQNLLFKRVNLHRYDEGGLSSWFGALWGEDSDDDDDVGLHKSRIQL